MCNATSNVLLRLGSARIGQSNSHGTMIRCPELEIGANSVSALREAEDDRLQDALVARLPTRSRRAGSAVILSGPARPPPGAPVTGRLERVTTEGRRTPRVASARRRPDTSRNSTGAGVTGGAAGLPGSSSARLDDQEHLGAVPTVSVYGRRPPNVASTSTRSPARARRTGAPPPSRRREGPSRPAPRPVRRVAASPRRGDGSPATRSGRASVPRRSIAPTLPAGVTRRIRSRPPTPRARAEVAAGSARDRTTSPVAERGAPRVSAAVSADERERAQPASASASTTSDPRPKRPPSYEHAAHPLRPSEGSGAASRYGRRCPRLVVRSKRREGRRGRSERFLRWASSGMDAHAESSSASRPTTCGPPRGSARRAARDRPR